MSLFEIKNFKLRVITWIGIEKKKTENHLKENKLFIFWYNILEKIFYILMRKRNNQLELS